MYGLSHFSLQLNYFPKRLQKVVAPTDTRRRPDMRSFENGDMIEAQEEKDRLEEKQRYYFRYLADHPDEQHEPKYFKKEFIESDDQDYYVYNGTYFE